MYNDSGARYRVVIDGVPFASKWQKHIEQCVAIALHWRDCGSTLRIEREWRDGRREIVKEYPVNG